MKCSQISVAGCAGPLLGWHTTARISIYFIYHIGMKVCKITGNQPAIPCHNVYSFTKMLICPCLRHVVVVAAEDCVWGPASLCQPTWCRSVNLTLTLVSHLLDQRWRVASVPILVVLLPGTSTFSTPASLCTPALLEDITPSSFRESPISKRSSISDSAIL